MRKLLAIGCLLFTAFAASAQDSSTSAFEAANAAYEAGKFDEAITQYEALTAEGESAALYFNLGNAYFKTNAVAKAILYYERALQLKPGDPDVLFNLKLANDRTKDKIEKLPELNITRWWKRMTLSMGIDTWGWLSIVFMLVACGLLLLFLVSRVRSVKTFAFYFGLLFLVGSGFTYFQAAQAQAYAESQTEAIIMTPRVDVKGAPTQSGVNVFVIHAGTKVRVIGERDGWVNIRIASGNEGWIPENDCTII